LTEVPISSLTPPSISDISSDYSASKKDQRHTEPPPRCYRSRDGHILWGNVPKVTEQQWCRQHKQDDDNTTPAARHSKSCTTRHRNRLAGGNNVSSHCTTSGVYACRSRISPPVSRLCRSTSPS
jgi:hypothetical protein